MLLPRTLKPRPVVTAKPASPSAAPATPRPAPTAPSRLPVKAVLPTLKPASGVGRARFTSKKYAEYEEDKNSIYSHLQALASLDKQLDSIVAEREVHLAKVEELMRKHKLAHMQGSGLVAEIREKFSRQSLTVDPRKYRASVTANDFWKSITVSVGEARQLLGEKELLRISDIVPAKSQGFHLVVKEASARER